MNESDLKVLEMDSEKQSQRALLLKIALDVLSHRALTLIALLLNAGAASWCMINPDTLRVVTALLFALTTWCLINIRPRQGEAS